MTEEEFYEAYPDEREGVEPLVEEDENIEN